MEVRVSRAKWEKPDRLYPSSFERAAASGAMVRIEDGPTSWYRVWIRRRGTLIEAFSSMSRSRLSRLWLLRRQGGVGSMQ